MNPTTPVKDVIRLMFLKGFNGVPVVDESSFLVGIITEYDFISKGSPIYFSPLGRILKELQPYTTDEKKIEEKIKEMLSSEAFYIMNTQPITLSPDNSITETADLFLRHHRINPIPVVDNDGRLVGLVSRSDLIKLYLDPSFWKRMLEEAKNS